MNQSRRPANKRVLTPARRRLFQALSIALSLLACFLCLEIGLRLFGPRYYRFNNTEREYYSNPRGYFEVLRKEGDRLVYGVPVQSWGWPPRRVPDNSLVDAGLQRFLSRKCEILGLGDSFAWGHGVRYEDVYLCRLAQLLRERGQPLAIDNIAQIGYDLPDHRKVYKIVSNRRRYPLVIYGFVLNDFGLPGKEQIIGSDYIDFDNGGYRANAWRERIATVNFISHKMETIRLDRITRMLYVEAFRGDNAREHFELLAQLNQDIRTDGGELVIVLFPLLYDLQNYPFEEIHEKIADFCRQTSIPLLDLLPEYSKFKAEELWVHPTDHHPNEIAHEIAADELYAFLQRNESLDAIALGQAHHPQ